MTTVSSCLQINYTPYEMPSEDTNYKKILIMNTHLLTL